MIEFTEVQAQNFMPFGSFHVTLDKAGIVAVRGQTDTAFSDSNGAGKSGLFEAIYWCLYGDLLRGGKADDVVNNRAKKDTYVVVAGNFHGRHVRIQRYRKHVEKKNAIDVFEAVDGQWVDRSSQDARDTQKVIDQFLGLDKALFGSTVVFGGRELASFMNAGDAGRKALFEKLLGLERFEAGFKLAGDRVSRFDAEVSRHAQTAVQAMTRRDEAREESVAGERQRDGWEASRQAEIKKLDDQIAAAGDIDRQLKEWDDYRRGWEAHEAAIKATDETVRQQWKGPLEDASAEVQKARDAGRDARRDYDRLKRLVESAKCPECEQETNTDGWSTRLVEAEKLVAQSTTALAAATENLQRLQSECTAAINSVTADLPQVREAFARADDAIRRLRTQLTAVERLKTLRESYKVGVNPHETAVQSALTRLQREEQRAREAEALKDKAFSDGAYYRFWREAFSRSGLRSFLLDSVIPEINTRANEYARILTDGDIAIVFSTQAEGARGKVTEKFDVRVLNAHGGESYDSCSSGERRRIDLCVALAIHDLIVAQTGGVNCVFLDEVFDTLDATGAERVVELLKAKAAYCKLQSVFVVTHNRDVANLFPKTWTVVKENGISRLEA